MSPARREFPLKKALRLFFISLVFLLFCDEAFTILLCFGGSLVFPLVSIVLTGLNMFVILGLKDKINEREYTMIFFDNPLGTGKEN
jgi:hypothetical protein